MLTRHVLWIVLIGLSATAVAQEPSGAAAAYEKAYSLILAENWQAAATEMKSVADKYPQSEWRDDASFWRCYAQAKMSGTLEQAVQCYQDFIKSNPDSKWINDAQMNLVQAAKTLTKQGKPGYEALVKSYEKDADMDLKLTALHALMNMNDEKATDALLNIYDTTAEPEMREKMLFILSELDDPRAQKKLMDIALKDKDPNLRQKAIFWIGDKAENKETVELIYNVALNDPDKQVREHAIAALAEVEAGLGMPYLHQIAKNHQDADMRSKAVFWIGDNAESADQVKFLVDVVKNDPDRRVREQAIFALSEANDNIGMPFVREIAKSDKDAEMRKKAIFWVGDKAETAEDIRFLEQIANTDANAEVREQAIFAIAESDELGLTSLINIAKNHPDPSLRKKAVFWLGESDDDRARQALLDILQGSGN